MPTSYNGWPASPDLRTRPLVLAGESFSPGVLDDDDVYEVLRYVAEQMHTRVEPVVRDDWHQADDWGFSYRPNTNDPTRLSCHASATAIDYNATRHPNAVATASTFTPAQIAEVHDILAELDGVVVWGGDFRTTPDAMHFELATTDRARLHAVAERIREGEDDMPYPEDQLRKIIRQESRAAVREELADVDDARIANPEKDGPGSRSLGVMLWLILKLLRKVAKKVGA